MQQNKHFIVKDGRSLSRGRREVVLENLRLSKALLGNLKKDSKINLDIDHLEADQSHFKASRTISPVPQAENS